MSTNYEVAGVLASWDVGSFLENARGTIQLWGGALVGLLGVAAIVWGGVTLVLKLMANQQNEGKYSWMKIILLLLIGGALAAGGWALLDQVSSGGRTTIEELGGGTIQLSSFFG